MILKDWRVHTARWQHDGGKDPQAVSQASGKLGKDLAVYRGDGLAL